MSAANKKDENKIRPCIDQPPFADKPNVAEGRCMFTHVIGLLGFWFQHFPDINQK